MFCGSKAGTTCLLRAWIEAQCTDRIQKAPYVWNRALRICPKRSNVYLITPIPWWWLVLYAVQAQRRCIDHNTRQRAHQLENYFAHGLVDMISPS